MAIGASLLLIAAGAILRWAVTAETDGISLDTVGLILLIVGAVGLLLSLVLWSSWAPFGGWRRREVVREEHPVVYDDRP